MARHTCVSVAIPLSVQSSDCPPPKMRLGMERFGMEALGAMALASAFVVFVTSIVALFRPLPQFWLPDKRRAGIAAAVSFVLMVGIANLLPQPEREPEPVQEEPAPVVAAPVQEEAISDAACSVDVDCWAKRHLAEATVKCTEFLSLTGPYWEGRPWEHLVRDRESQLQILRAQGEMLFSEWTWFEGSSREIISYWGNQYRFKDGRIITTPRFSCHYSPKEEKTRSHLINTFWPG